jgi:hypothetical protein
LVGKVTMVESWMSRNTPHGHGQWVRPVPQDCDPQHVGWDLFLNDRPKEPFNGNRFINWRLFWEFSGGNITENMVHQIAWIITVLNPQRAARSHHERRRLLRKRRPPGPRHHRRHPRIPDLTVLWQSTFSNSHFGLGERFLGSDGTIEHISGSTDMVTGKSASGIHFYPEKPTAPTAAPSPAKPKRRPHAKLDRLHPLPQQADQRSGRNRLFSAVAAHMANLAFRKKRRITFEEAKAIKQPY